MLPLSCIIMHTCHIVATWWGEPDEIESYLDD